MDRPLVSVCINTFNRCDMLKKCIDSILIQSYSNIEILIFENASVDDTSTYLWNLMSEHSNVEVVFASKQYSNAMFTLNTLFNMATGDYILVIDDDAELIDHHAIVDMLLVMESYKNVAIMGVDVIGLDGKTQMPLKDEHGNVINERQILSYCDFKGACAMFRTSVCKSLGYYDEGFKLYMNELDMSLRCIKAGYEVINNPFILVMHAGGNNLGNSNQYLSNYQEVIYRNFNKLNGVKLMLLNYAIVCHYKGHWLSNFYITGKYILKLLLRHGVITCPTKWQQVLLNGTIQAIKVSI